MDFVKKKGGKWRVLSKSYIDKYGCQHLNAQCNACGNIKCVLKAKLYSGEYDCDCKRTGNK